MAAASSAPLSGQVIQISRATSPLIRDLAVTRARLAKLTADRARLYAKIAQLEHAVQNLQKSAHHDELTGLPNRRLLEDRYRQAVARSNRSCERVALLFIDIDRFKQINDSFGHDAADRVLQQLAVRLVACIRASDTACRYGGDEFVVLLCDCHGEADAAATISRIREQLATPFLVDSAAFRLSVSIGMALYPTDGPGMDKLIRAADAGMFREKTKCTSAPNSARAIDMNRRVVRNEGAAPGASL